MKTLYDIGQLHIASAMSLTNDPVVALAGLQETISSLKCNKQSRVYFDELNEHLSELQPQLESSISTMREAAAFGETIKQGQIKAFQASAETASYLKGTMKCGRCTFLLAPA